MPDTTRATPVLDTAGVALLLRVAASTVARWRVRYRDTQPCPEPAGHIGGHPYWTDRQAWVDWAAGRRGQGWRKG